MQEHKKQQTQLQITRAVAADTDALQAVAQRTFAASDAAFGFSPQANRGPRFRRSRSFMEACIVQDEAWKLTAAGQIMGGVLVLHGENGLSLEGIFIDPPFQGCGYGQQALRFVLAQHPQESWHLRTPAEDVRDHYFYEKFGFVKTSEEAGHAGGCFWLYALVR